MADYSNDAFIIRDLNDKWVIYIHRRSYISLLQSGTR